MADMSKKYQSIQFRVYESTHYKLRLMAIQEHMTLAEFILRALANQDNPELTKLINAELKHRPKPGLPQTRKMYLKLFLRQLPPKFIRHKYVGTH